MRTLKKLLSIIMAVIMLTGCMAINASAAVSNERYSVLVLDVSGSMSGSPVAEVRKAAVAFCEKVLSSYRSSNKIAVVAFASGSRVVCDFTNDLTALTEGIEALTAGGGTDLASGLSTAKSLLEGVDENAIKNMLVMCDGAPNSTTAAYNVIYSIPFHWNVYGMYFSTGGFSNGAANVMKTIGRNGYAEVKTADQLLFEFVDNWGGTVTNNSANNVVVLIACPVDVEVTLFNQTLSKYNPKTTFGTLEITTDENGDEIKTLTLAYNPSYEINISGYGEGEMDCTVTYMCNDQTLYSMSYPTVSVTETTKIKTHINVEESSITLDVDNDGDGIVDENVNPNASASSFLYRIKTFFENLFYKIKEFFAQTFGSFGA